MARLRQQIAELLAQLSKLKVSASMCTCTYEGTTTQAVVLATEQAALKDLQGKAAAEAAARLAREMKLLAALRKEAATRQSLSATMKNMNDAANLMQMRAVCWLASLFRCAGQR